MYQHQQEPFGKFTKHKVSNPLTGDSFSFIPERSAVLISLVLNNTEVLDGYQTPQEVINDNWSKSRLLYPFPNRLRDGHLHWLGKDYQWPINDELRENALHGFSTDRLFQLDTSTVKETGAITCIYDYDGHEEYFPFPFRLEVTYALQSAHQFQVNMKLRNNASHEIPIGLGWHPYFKLTENIHHTEMLSPSMEMIGVDARMIPTGKQYPYELFSRRKKIGEEVLDNCFVLITPDARAAVHLWGDEKQLSYWQESGPGKYNYIQIFTPPHRQSIAIEPMTCNINAYHNQEGLHVLQTGEQVEVNCGLGLST